MDGCQGLACRSANWLSKGENCPFIGHSLPGLVRYTLVDGRISHQA